MDSETTTTNSNMDSPCRPEEALTTPNVKKVETPATEGMQDIGSPEMEGIKSDLTCKFANGDDDDDDDDKDDAPPTQQWSRTKKIMCLLISLLVVAAVVITSVLLTYDGNETVTSNENSAEYIPITPVAPSPPVSPPIAPIFAQPTAPGATPTEPVPTARPTTSPTMVPTATPTVSVASKVVEFLAANQVFVNEQDPSATMAITVLADEIGEDLGAAIPSKVIQRFALLTLDFALRTSGRVDIPEPDSGAPMDGDATDAPVDGNSTGGFFDATTSAPVDGNTTGGFFDATATANPDGATDQGDGNFFDVGSEAFADAFGGIRRLQEAATDECFWEGVTCVDGVVTEIRFYNRQMEGTIPTEIALLSDLKFLDLSQNQLHGMIPEEVYSLVQMENLFLYQNQLTGSISSSVGNWWNITHLHLSHNQLTGSIPVTMKSDSSIRPYYYINFKSNQLTGSIPENLRWRNVFYVDLGNNQLTGTLPSDIGETFPQLRHFFLDHNQFVGTLPELYINAGNGRLEQFALNDNQLTGAVPGNHELYNNLVSYRLENNNFDQALDSGTCRLSVFAGGENVDFKADCEICSCRGDFFCANCQ